MTVKTALLTLALALPLAARAADVPTTYTVNDTALKAAIAGTNLTFTLYTDAACTQQAYQQVVPIETVAFVSRLKRFTPKSAPKGPNIDEVHETLTGVSAAGNLYLTVSGTGITPVGGACQVQAALVRPAANIPYQKTGLHYSNTLSTWMVENPPTTGLGFPQLNGLDLALVVTEPAVVNTLAAFDQTKRYQCSAQLSGQTTPYLNWAFPLDLKGCSLHCGISSSCQAGDPCLYNSDCQSNICQGSGPVCQ
jgi:hypothetical protein